jgi:hypothetical protein
MYKGILSLEALGNPITFFGKLGTGVHDIFYEPLQCMLKGPEEFAQGVHKGGKSFQDNVLRGVGEAIHKASGAMGKSLAELTRDSQYLEKRSAGNSAVLRQGPGPSKRSVAEGALHGAVDRGAGSHAACRASSISLSRAPKGTASRVSSKGWVRARLYWWSCRWWRSCRW